MSGIAGIVRRARTGVTAQSLGRMAAAIRHRGPDGYGFYSGRSVGLTHVRLGVADVGSAGQPLTNEDGQIVVTSDCEVFNHPELRRELEDRGHVFRTRCHAEVLVHGYEEWGVDLLQRLDGQFALAIYDRTREEVLVARDRLGVRPLFYAQQNGDFFFGSEIKAILATGEVEPAVDRRGLDETLRFGASRPPRTAFSGIASLEPGTYGVWNDGALWLHRYYELDYPEAGEEPVDVIEQLDEIMLRSVGMRMRAEVPVGAYVDGGLNASLIASLARRPSANTLRTFSAAYAVGGSAATSAEEDAAAAIGSEHTAASITGESLARTFPDVLWHAETPLLSATPALMFHLARLTRQSGIKVVVDAVGGDEIFLGNDVFKELSVRAFCLRQPESRIRPMLFDRIRKNADAGFNPGDAWFRSLLEGVDRNDPLFSHLPRFTRGRISDLYTSEFRAELGGVDVIAELRASLPTRFFGWSSLNKAAYIEMTTRLSPYVLSSCSDRMTMAHGVAARHPFLDHRLFEFAAGLPTSSRLRGLRGKEVLNRWASRVLPHELQGERGATQSVPGVGGFVKSTSPSWVAEHMSAEALHRVGVFSEPAVAEMVRRCRESAGAPGADSKAFMGVLSTQLWHEQFIQNAMFIAPLPVNGASVLLSDGSPLVSTR